MHVFHGYKRFVTTLRRVCNLGHSVFIDFDESIVLILLAYDAYCLALHSPLQRSNLHPTLLQRNQVAYKCLFRESNLFSATMKEVLCFWHQARWAQLVWLFYKQPTFWMNRYFDLVMISVVWSIICNLNFTCMSSNIYNDLEPVVMHVESWLVDSSIHRYDVTCVLRRRPNSTISFLGLQKALLATALNLPKLWGMQTSLPSSPLTMSSGF